jgi:hypothetical protein
LEKAGQNWRRKTAGFGRCCSNPEAHPKRSEFFTNADTAATNQFAMQQRVYHYPEPIIVPTIPVEFIRGPIAG